MCSSDLEADFITKQDFSSGDDFWKFELRINGTVIYAADGTRVQDSIPLAGSISVGAGTHTATVRWQGDPNVALGNRQLRLKGYPATE